MSSDLIALYVCYMMSKNECLTTKRLPFAHNADVLRRSFHACFDSAHCFRVALMVPLLHLHRARGIINGQHHMIWVLLKVNDLSDESETVDLLPIYFYFCIGFL